MCYFLPFHSVQGVLKARILKWFAIRFSSGHLSSEEVARIHRRTIQKDLHDPDNHGVITHLEPDLLECEVKWVLGSITTNKASGGDGIPVEHCFALPFFGIGMKTPFPVLWPLLSFPNLLAY